MKNQALLLFLLALTTTYVECLPIETEAVKESNEIAEERTIVYDPTVDTGKFKNWDGSFTHTKCVAVHCTDFTIKVGKESRCQTRELAVARLCHSLHYRQGFLFW